MASLSRRAAVLGGLACIGATAVPENVAVPIDVANRRCVVPVSLDGRMARMTLDTGAELTLVTTAAVARLGLRLDQWVGTTLRDAGGHVESHADADVVSATVGGVALYQRRGSGGLSLPVTHTDLGGVDGLLGGDVLRHTTLDLDVSAGRLVLRPAGERVPGADAIPLQVLRQDLLLAPVRLDGRELMALLDTGAASSFINARGLYKLGLSPERSSRDPGRTAQGVARAFEAHLHSFGELRVGGLTVPNPEILTAPVPEPAYDMLLGLDVLGQHRVVLSYANATLEFL